MEGASAAARDKRRQRYVEQALERRADQVLRALPAELEERIAIDGGNRAGAIEREDAFAPGADQFRPAVEAHDKAVAEAMQEEPVLDHLRRHVDQHQRVLLRAIRFAGGIEHRKQLAAMVVDGRGTAGEAGVAGEEMM